MRPIHITTVAIFLSLLSGVLSARVTNANKVPKNAVLLSKVSSLTLRSGKQTSARRVSSVPQLKCVGPPEVCKLYQIDVMRCTNEGADYDQENIQWACKASLPEEFKLGGTDVSCEGYESSQDPYVLKGSCGVEYRLLLTDKGDEKYGSQHNFDYWNIGRPAKSEKYAGYIFMAVFFGVLGIILYNIYQAARRERGRPRGNRPGGGGGGDGGNDDPPPPYDPYPRTNPSKKNYTGARSSSSRTNTGSQRNQGWQPGFWTGTAAGATAAYLFGNRGRTQTQTQTQTQPQTQRTAPGASWFGGNRGMNQARSAPSSSSSSSSPSYSSSRHDSTGFGGTSRR